MKAIKTLLIVTALSACLMSCGQSARSDSALIDTLENRYAQSRYKFQVYSDTSGLSEALDILDQLIALKPREANYLFQKIHVVVEAKRYDEARAMLNDSLVALMFERVKELHGGGKEYARIKIDALEAYDKGDSTLYRSKVDSLESMVREYLFSDGFDMEYFCRHRGEVSEKVIAQGIAFNSWLGLLNVRGGKEEVIAELEKLKSDYGLTDEFDDYLSDDYMFHENLDNFLVF